MGVLQRRERPTQKLREAPLRVAHRPQMESRCPVPRRLVTPACFPGPSSDDSGFSTQQEALMVAWGEGKEVLAAGAINPT